MTRILTFRTRKTLLMLLFYVFPIRLANIIIGRYNINTACCILILIKIIIITKSEKTSNPQLPYELHQKPYNICRNAYILHLYILHILHHHPSHGIR